MVKVARWSTVRTQASGGMARSLTFTKLTPRSNAVKYRTSGAETDKTCGFLSVNADPLHIHLPDASAVFPAIDSSWSVVKTRPESNKLILIDQLRLII